MVGFRPAWFLHVNPDADFPRYTKTIDLTPRPGLLIGPVEDKHAAARLIQLAEDAFDLCRYYQSWSRRRAARRAHTRKWASALLPATARSRWSNTAGWSNGVAETLVDPEPFVRDQSRRMQFAAAEVRFEIAGKIKAFVDSISTLGKGAFRHVRPLKDFAFLSLQHGPREGTAKVFLVTPGRIEQIFSLIAEPTRPRPAAARACAGGGARPPATDAGRRGAGRHRRPPPVLAETQGPKGVGSGAAGVFLPIDQIEEKSFIKAWRDLKKQPPGGGTRGGSRGCDEGIAGDE